MYDTNQLNRIYKIPKREVVSVREKDVNVCGLVHILKGVNILKRATWGGEKRR